MSILLSLILAHAPVLPQVDRRSLDLQARAEERLSRRPTPTRPATTQARGAVGTPVQPRPPLQAAAASSRAPGPRPTPAVPASGSAMDQSAIATVCRAARSQIDPSAFLDALSRAFSLSVQESSSLRTNCAAYQAGHADARQQFSSASRVR